jgi:uncharacterized phage protein gp47/JayE
MPTSNTWLNPYQRSYESIKNTLIGKMRARMPEMTDFSEGNIFVMLISAFAAIAEVIHYYIDNMAREAFLYTARKYDSLYKQAKLVDYHIKNAIPATVDVVLYLPSGTYLENETEIPLGTQFSSDDGTVWVSTKAITWKTNRSSVVVPLIQKEASSKDLNLGTIPSGDILIYINNIENNKYYVEGSLQLNIGGEAWEEVQTFAYATATDKVFKVEPNASQIPTISFGDGQFGMKPKAESAVTGSYDITTGENGNIHANSFNTVPTSIANIDNRISILQPEAASGGSNYESFENLRDHIGLSIKTLGVAITKEDYEDLTMSIAGVSKAYVNYICGKTLEVYISPDGGTEASLALRDKVVNTLNQSKVITTNISVKSTHKAVLYLNATIQGKRSYNKEVIQKQVKEALLNAYNESSSSINQVVRLSDIYALIDNLASVDYVDIDKIYIRSYPIPSTSSFDQVPPLEISYFNQISFDASKASTEGFEVKITDTGYSIIDSYGHTTNGTYGEVLSVVGQVSNYQITIQDSGYTVGDSYTFVLQPMNVNLTPYEFGIPVFEDSTIQITANEII